jgi:hypothetical protein
MLGVLEADAEMEFGVQGINIHKKKEQRARIG